MVLFFFPRCCCYFRFWFLKSSFFCPFFPKGDSAEGVSPGRRAWHLGRTKLTLLSPTEAGSCPHCRRVLSRRKCLERSPDRPRGTPTRHPVGCYQKTHLEADECHSYIPTSQGKTVMRHFPAASATVRTPTPTTPPPHSIRPKMAASSEVPEHGAGRPVVVPCSEGPPRAVLTSGVSCCVYC